MPNNRTKTDRLHDELPKLFNTRQNPNWNALIESIGESDQDVADLVEEVRKQFFVKTASRPYLDRLGANSKISRPRFVGMDDPTLRQYIPVLAYQPKQVKAIVDQLLDLFFFKEATTSFTTTNTYEPFHLQDGWELEYTADSVSAERIQFDASAFTNIATATADEVVGAINRQAKHSFAVVFDDSISKRKYIKLFTNTTGAKGAIEITGGRADIGLQFNGYLTETGNDPTTVWTVTVVGDLVTFQHTGGTSPNIQRLIAGDVVMIDLPNNSGSFKIENVDISNEKFSFRNLFGTAGTYNHATLPNTYVKFLRPLKAQVFKSDLRAISWEVQSGRIVVEMPASPPVVRRSLAGSAHLNGKVALMSERTADDQLKLDNTAGWPDSGRFAIEPLLQLLVRAKTTSENTVLTEQFQGRMKGFDTVYAYTGKSGNTLTGITPALPVVATLNEYSIQGTFSRNAQHLVQMTTTVPHTFVVGDEVCVANTTYVSETPTGFTDDPVKLIVPIEGTFRITKIVDAYTFEFYSLGDEGQASGGTVRAEKPGLAPFGSKVLLKSAKIDTGIKGPYMWDLAAPFVLSSLTAQIQTQIQAGNTIRSIDISASNGIPNEEGFIVFGFGTQFQEGPIRYLYKPTDNSLAIDPAYVFKYNHSVGSSITLIRSRGAHSMSGLASEYPMYVTDPSLAREILQDLIRQVKSVGIFIEFLVRYPEQLYATLDVYRSGIDPG